MPIDYSEYPDDWKEISRRIRQDRAGNKCEHCFAENHMPHPETGSVVILTVAHLNHDKNDNRDDNLAALCQKCHLAHDRGHHIMNRKFGRHRNRKEQGRLF